MVELVGKRLAAAPLVAGVGVDNIDLAAAKENATAAIARAEQAQLLAAAQVYTSYYALRTATQRVTTAGELLAMLQGIDAIGNDLAFRGNTAAPTIRFRELTVSGE